MISPTPTGPALPGPLQDTPLQRLLEPVHFTDLPAAVFCLQRMARHPGASEALVEMLPALAAVLQQAPAPDLALVSLERFSERAPEPAALFAYLASTPHSLDILATLFCNSQFLTEILLRNPDAFYRLKDPILLSQLKSDHDYLVEGLWAVSQAEAGVALIDALRRYQRAELLRIGVCDLLGQFDLSAVTGQLSSLANGMIQACLTITSRQLRLHKVDGTPPDGFAVLGMGKLGGRELNYSSDIDLLFISSSSQDSFQKLGEKLIDALAKVTDEGFLYRVDMRLRPWGTSGALVITEAGYLEYLKDHALLWEKQALLKARCIAGEIHLGEKFLQQAYTLVYSCGAGEVRSGILGMKQRTEAHLRSQGRDWGEVKLGEGSIRDAEFAVQSLQLIYGAKQPEIRSRNTLHALERLRRFGYLPVEDYLSLQEGYIFFRTVEHYLQLMHYRQTHTLPREPAALNQLARRLGFHQEDAANQFTTRFLQHSRVVRDLFLKYLGEQEVAMPELKSSVPAVRQHIERMDPSYETAFSAQDIARHATLASQLDENHLVFVDAALLEDGAWRVAIVAFDYPGELSLICGMMFAYSLAIHDGDVFTYEPAASSPQSGRPGPRKIVDVFTVRLENGGQVEGLWERYAADLEDLLRLMRSGERQEARVRLVKKVGQTLRQAKSPSLHLYPVDIEIDNAASANYSVLSISAADTTGFLYELTNALALNRVYIARVQIDTVGQRIQDTLYVTDFDGQKITAPDRQRQLRVATVLIKHFTHLLPLSPDPEAAMLHFHAFVGDLFRKPNWPDELASLERPEVLGALAQLLGVSDFLWDDFLRMQHSNLFPVVTDLDALQSSKTHAQLQSELEAALRQVHDGPQAPRPDAPWREVVNSFKDREMFRIDMRHILNHTHEFWDFAEELTGLAEVVVNSAYHLAAEDLRRVYGRPLMEDGSSSQMAVFVLGKCGGREMGFASDIELMFIYSGNGKTSGPEVITSSEFHEKVVESFTQAIRTRREGVFEIDLALRPYGKAGPLAVSVESFRRYFGPEGAAWPYERQALVRLRPVAGDPGLGKTVAGLRDAFVYTGRPYDVVAMRAMRERQIRHLVRAGTFNPKFSPGGLVDVEYLVQGLQITHGGQNPTLRTPNTRQALAALAEAGILSPDDFTRLRKAHTFLRWLIDSLRMVAGNAKDLEVPREGSEQFAYLARRLRYGENTTALHADLLAHTTFVQEINRRLLK